MKDLIKAVDNLPWIVKLILCLPAVDIVWAIYRVARSVVAKNTLGIILGVLCVIGACSFLWIIDIICVVLNKKVWWFC